MVVSTFFFFLRLILFEQRNKNTNKKEARMEEYREAGRKKKNI